MTTTDDATRAAYVAQSEWLGASAAQQAASWLVLSVAQARAILNRDTCNDAVSDLPAPSLSGEWADDLTPDLLAQEVGLTREHLTVCADDFVDELTDAWEQGRDLVWWDAVRAVALRLTGEIAAALRLEDVIDHNVNALEAIADDEHRAAQAA
jgi:hypothetical protein